MGKIEISKEKIIELYVDKRMSQAECAKELGCT